MPHQREHQLFVKTPSVHLFREGDQGRQTEYLPSGRDNGRDTREAGVTTSQERSGTTSRSHAHQEEETLHTLRPVFLELEQKEDKPKAKSTREDGHASWIPTPEDGKDVRTQKQGDGGSTKHETKADMKPKTAAVKPPAQGTPRLRGVNPQQARAAPAVHPRKSHGTMPSRVGERHLEAEAHRGAMLGLRQGDLRWMPDEKCTKCFACGEPFSAWRRRHHCRLCGQIFCYSCSNNFIPGKLVGRPTEGKSRLCESCLEFCDESLIIQRSSAASAGLVAGMQLFRRENRASTEDEDTVEQEDVDDQPSVSDGEDVPQMSEHLESLSYSVYNPDSEVTTRGVWYWGDEPNSRGQRAPANHRAEVGLPEESIEHLNQSWEGLDPEDLEGLAAGQRDAQVTEWRNMAEANFRHFVTSVREYCLEAGEGLEDQEHMLTICKLAQQAVDQWCVPVVKQLRLGPSDSMDILNYLSLGRAKLSTVMRSEAIGTWGQEATDTARDKDARVVVVRANESWKPD
ncbi:1-phosphatidylinositol 3-phosphate 5-kinase [Symbiodinium microadriaticum]|uniref:1-phosphatidylinositol 3-phosphate 5-kinase n=1 Tax=Symbiodinium microadriaticum TaxID=2951 RepID=A0A1Q9ERY7_SYMMI|nr:1-phosphatidylinositol 3-phosphate 5-kinase [Symbiodinium microadriaticum]